MLKTACLVFTFKHQLQDKNVSFRQALNVRQNFYFNTLSLVQRDIEDHSSDHIATSNTESPIRSLVPYTPNYLKRKFVPTKYKAIKA
jgi:hypothetical protein